MARRAAETSTTPVTAWPQTRWHPQAALDVAWEGLAGRRGLDPYLSWGLATGWRAAASGARVAQLAFVVELDRADDLDGVAALPGVTVPGLYRRVAAGMRPRHVTLRLAVPADDPAAQAAAVQSLLAHPAIVRAQLGLATPARPARTEPPVATASASPAPRQRVLLGMVDDACPFAHVALRDRLGNTRVLALWDQQRAPGGLWSAPVGVSEGAELDQAAMTQALDGLGSTAEPEEEALYARRDFDARAMRGRASHGAAVAGLLAGRLNRLPPRVPLGALPQEVDGPSHGALLQDTDPASEMGLVAVAMPRRAVLTTSGRWLAVHALDALAYLQAARVRFGADRMVANLSYGGHAGAHDGSSLFEAAIDELLLQDPALTLVLPAGNGHGSALDPDAEGGPLVRLPSGVHATLPALRPGQTGEFLLQIPPDKQFETNLELWFSRETAATASARAASHHLRPGEVSVQVQAPSGTVTATSFPGIAVQSSAEGEAVAGLVCWPRVPQSRHRSMALVVVAPTQASSRRPQAQAGRWRVSVHLSADARDALAVQAWVERDDTIVGGRRGQAARLVEGEGDSAARLDDRGSFNNIANGSRAVVVGALVARDLDRPGGGPSPSPYAAAAPDGGTGPGFSAACDQGLARPGLAVIGNRSGVLVRANGSSLAAPWVARHLANELARSDAPQQPGRGQPLSLREGTGVP